MGKSLFGLMKVIRHGPGPGEEFRRTNQGISERPENGCGMRDKMAEEINKTKELLKVLDGGRLRIVSNGLDMRGEGCDASGHHVVTKKINRGTFLEVDQNAIGHQKGEEIMNMLETLEKGRAGHQDVV